ncbi:MAG: tripartite tricarboxylate transporter substrate binding protein [Bdellovibrionota bacterium]
MAKTTAIFPVFFSTLFAIQLVAKNVAHGQEFPKRPIKLIVYTKPGGAIDVFARKFEKIAAKYHKGKILIVNKPGAGGIIAMKKLQAAKSDGYTIGAITKSVIGKMATNAGEFKLDSLTWLGLLVSEPEAIIVNNNTPLNDWKKVVQHNQSSNGNQLWVGPSPGGNDHIFATKLWEKVGLKAKWIPYSGGGKAMTALLGNHGDVYVGNVSDIVGKPNLKAIAIANKARLKGEWSNIPTLSELGISGFEGEDMWRGFVAPKNLDPQASKFYKDLLNKVTKDADWNKFISKSGATALLVEGSAFKKDAENNYQEFSSIGKKLGLAK